MLVRVDCYSIMCNLIGLYIPVLYNVLAHIFHSFSHSTIHDEYYRHQIYLIMSEMNHLELHKLSQVGSTHWHIYVIISLVSMVSN